MDPSTADDPTALLATPFLWPMAVARSWSSLLNLAPQSLVQPINPGWTLGNVINITENNSTAPDTEREVLNKHSYGRQLGRIMDALTLVLEAGVVDRDSLSDAKRKRLDDFLELKKDIDDVKVQEAMKRVARIKSDLEFLRERHSVAFGQAQELLSEASAVARPTGRNGRQR